MFAAKLQTDPLLLVGRSVIDQLGVYSQSNVKINYKAVSCVWYRYIRNS